MQHTTSSIKIVVTGGGTGGHVLPVVAVVQELRQKHPSLRITWIGEANSFEQSAAERQKIPFLTVKTGKFRRYFSLRNVLDIVKVAVGYVQSLYYLVHLRPAVVFSKAGYVSVPTILAAATLRIPIVAHESDTVMGLANSIASRFATRFCSGFPFSFYESSISHKTVFTGNPQVHELAQQDQTGAYAHFDFQQEVPIVLILGGSQGALSINTVVWEALEGLLSEVQIIHQIGSAHVVLAEKMVENLPHNLRRRYRYAGYFDHDELSRAYSIAILAVARAGANTIADLSSFEIPAILIPLPHAASNHQLVNAQFVVERGGAILLPQSDLNARSLYESVTLLLHDDKKRLAMRRAIGKLNPKNARERIADVILAVAKETR